MHYYAQTILSAVLGLATAWIHSADAAPTVQGSVVIRIQDGAGNGRCIGSADRLTATLRRVIMEKKTKWLGLVEDTELGLTFTTTVSGSSGDEVKSASFVRVVKEQVRQFNAGQILLAQEQNLLSKFALTNGTNKFSVIDIDIGIVRSQGKSIAAKIILDAVGATKSLTLPTNPFASAFSAATAYVNGFVEPLISQAAAQQEAASHRISMSINAANCTGDDEKTGTKAIINTADDISKPGAVDTSKINDYCFKAELAPAFALKAAPRPAGGDCTKVTNFQELQNSYLAFFVNSFPPGTPSPDVSSMGLLKLEGVQLAESASLSRGFRNLGFSANAAEQFSKGVLSAESNANIAKAFKIKPDTVSAYREALKRCVANGVSAADCFN